MATDEGPGRAQPSLTRCHRRILRPMLAAQRLRLAGVASGCGGTAPIAPLLARLRVRGRGAARRLRPDARQPGSDRAPGRSYRRERLAGRGGALAGVEPKATSATPMGANRQLPLGRCKADLVWSTREASRATTSTTIMRRCSAATTSSGGGSPLTRTTCRRAAARRRPASSTLAHEQVHGHGDA
jgi:hypothetical protein